MRPSRLAAQWALVVLTAGALARLTTGSRGFIAFGSVAAIGALTAALAGRRLPAVAAWDVAALFVVLAVVVAAEPSRSWFGLPTPGAFRATFHALSHATGSHVPTASSAGVIAAGGLLAGVLGAATMVLRGAWAAVPALLAATASCVALPSVGGAALGLLTMGAAAVLVLEPAAAGTGWLVAAGSLAAGATCLVALGPASAVSLGTGPGPAPAGSRPVLPATLFTLVSDLTGVERRDPNVQMFTARTPVATYWQVSSLSVLASSGQWVQSAPFGEVPGASAPGATTFTADVTVDELATTMLPVPPATLEVPGATVTPQGVLVAAPTSPGSQYRALAAVPAAVPADATVTTDPADLALPPLPPGITTLAHQLTVSATTPLQRALALEDWFRSSTFRYSLTQQPSLVDFLTASHAGSCQQFAGAFAILARIVGLPTRVAIGFTTGTRLPSGQTLVRGVDAHAWPEVLLGGAWVSFEPTPPQPSGSLVPAGVLGPAGQGNPNPVGSLPHGSTKGSVPTTAPVVPRPNTHHPHQPRAAAPSSTPWLAIGLSATALGLLVLAAFLFARRRRRARSTPLERVTRAYGDLDRALDRRGLGRPVWQTPHAHAQALARQVAPQDGADMTTVADLLERAVYAGTPLTAREAEDAEAAARRAVRGVRTGRSTSPV